MVYDSTNSESFDALKYWSEEIQKTVNSKYSTFVIASKIDLAEKEAVSIKDSSKYAKTLNGQLH